MKETNVSAPVAGFFQNMMEKACAAFDLDARQARRELRVSMAVNTFGMGTLNPKDLGKPGK
ncbi:hypothetical protein PSH61_13700 [Pseudomonas rhodesiae]|uniref:hypothetical protein n=1 Tax=Pseudomonas rhodesiae TaxID=76760 RepID=UPI0010937F8F|nr:hypothetical protein [Pseudomonas rhodesiae]TGY18631.1 hypothetical protein E5845_11030 [Pseudomonas fluorescens]WLI26898.1 hypothetical protein PSH61_13700 [Pseudomonas rhodesiae]